MDIAPFGDQRAARGVTILEGPKFAHRDVLKAEEAMAAAGQKPTLANRFNPGMSLAESASQRQLGSTLAGEAGRLSPSSGSKARRHQGKHGARLLGGGLQIGQRKSLVVKGEPG